MKILDSLNIKQIVRILSLSKIASSSWLLSVAAIAGSTLIAPISSIFTLGIPIVGGVLLMKLLSEFKDSEKELKSRLQKALDDNVIDKDDYNQALNGLKRLAELRKDTEQ